VVYREIGSAISGRYLRASTSGVKFQETAQADVAMRDAALSKPLSLRPSAGKGGRE